MISSYLRLILVSTICLLFSKNYLGAQCTPIAPAKLSLGGVLNKPSDADKDRPFNDVFKFNTGFYADPLAPFTSSPVAADSLGWPVQDFSVVVMTAMTPDMGGVYRLRFSGSADVAPLNSGFTVQNKKYDAASNTTTADLVYPAPLPSADNMELSFTHTLYDSGANGVKNIRIVKPGASFDGSTFSNAFLQHLNRFAVLNFSQWRNAANAGDSLWSQRTASNAAIQTGNKGVAWESCIELANTLNKDIWIHIPHKSDSSYARSLAQLLNAGLNKSLKIYIEYGTEVWNFSYPVAQWNTQQAEIEGRSPFCPYNADHSTDRFTLNVRRYAYKSKQLYDVFKDVFGAADFYSRVRIVYSGQIDWLEFSQRGLDFIEKTYGPPHNYFYALAVSPYLHANQLDAQKPYGATASEVVAGLQNTLAQTFSPDTVLLDQWSARAAYYGMKLFAYAGGINTASDFNIGSKADAARAPEMKDLVFNYLSKWNAYNPTGILNWNNAGAGDWNTSAGTLPLTENYENSYKLQGLDSALALPAQNLSAGQSVKGLVEAKKVATLKYGVVGADYYQPGVEPYIEYLIRVPSGEAGTYQFSVQSRSAVGTQFINLYVDDHFVTKVQIPYTGSLTGNFLNSDPITYKGFSEGLHTIRLVWVTTEFQLHGIVFTKTGDCQLTGVANLAQSGAAKVYPNPTSDFINIEFDAQQGIKTTLLLKDIWGRMVAAREIEPGRPINVSSIPSGMYFYEIESGGAIFLAGKITIIR